MKSAAKLFIVCLVCSVASAVQVQAGLIFSFRYTATGSSGESVTGVFGWDAGVTDSSFSDPSLGSYVGAGFWNGIVSGGLQDGATFSFSGLDVFVSDVPPLASSDSVGMQFSIRSFLVLSDSTGSVFSSDALPSRLLSSDFDNKRISLWDPDIGISDRFRQISYSVQSIEAVNTAVPEPTSLAIFGFGALSFVASGVFRRKRQPA